MARILLVSLAAVPLLAACAVFQASATEITPQQTAGLKATCSKIMRLNEGTSEFEGCVSSLADSLASQIHYDRTAYAYRDCAKDGLKRDSVDFSRCVLDRENAQPAAGSLPTGSATKLDAALVTPADANPRDYFEASFGTRRRREQYACAQLGLQPESGLFTGCVNNLDMNLFIVEHPPS